ncbi:hypothetical protein SAMN05444410_10697 [Hydrobacter penzbergensis]|uniref:Uncharacterized protein n=1 Tax=Hydrobacter penzbergensis TaxID=1235997 RepID=A0A8X8IF14_9BACT|nr:hypothetical protein [Hydrobacter penzbergensis]SDW83925.1 hypothetical protein SAMN05444410_10697 [Hydrobacter penzbergensis]
MKYIILFCIVFFSFQLESKSQSPINRSKVTTNVEDWEFIGYSGGENKYYLWKRYIEAWKDAENNQFVKTWFKVIINKFHFKEKVYTNATIKQMIEIAFIDRKMKIDRFVVYDSNGSIIEDTKFEFSDWEDIVPDSMQEVMLGKAYEIYNFHW